MLGVFGSVDVQASDNISIVAEGNYIEGFGDAENIRYINLIFGVVYHF